MRTRRSRGGHRACRGALVLVRGRRGEAQGAQRLSSLVLTVWETIPFLDTYSNRHARPHRGARWRRPTCSWRRRESARTALLLEGVPGPDRGRAARHRRRALPRAAPQTWPDRAPVVSPGRLVWEKGHQDVMRALAALPASGGLPQLRPRLLVVGSGPEEASACARHARELGIADHGRVPVRCPTRRCRRCSRARRAWCSRQPGHSAGGYISSTSRACSGRSSSGSCSPRRWRRALPIVASTSGAIPEVVGDSGRRTSPRRLAGPRASLADGSARAAAGRASRARPGAPAAVLDGRSGDAPGGGLRPPALSLSLSLRLVGSRVEQVQR